MSELRIPACDTLSVLTDAHGNLTIQLTEEGERKLLEEARLRSGRLAHLTERRRQALAAKPTAEFADLVQKRWGGPDQLERDEIGRRMQAIGRTLRPMFAAARAAGLLPAPAPVEG